MSVNAESTAALLLMPSSEGNGLSISGGGRPLVEYRRFIRDSTFDLSFGRTRGGGGREPAVPSARSVLACWRRGRFSTPLLFLRREFTVAIVRDALGRAKADDVPIYLSV